MAKTFNKNGKWIDKPGKTVIHECKCGMKFIKTRRNQKICIPCLVEGRAVLHR